MPWKATPIQVFASRPFIFSSPHCNPRADRPRLTRKPRKCCAIACTMTPAPLSVSKAPQPSANSAPSRIEFSRSELRSAVCRACATQNSHGGDPKWCAEHLDLDSPIHVSEDLISSSVSNMPFSPRRTLLDTYAELNSILVPSPAQYLRGTIK